MSRVRAGEQLGAAYRAINPQCTVPALRTEEGVVLADNAAITAYAEALKREAERLASTNDPSASSVACL